MTAKLKFPRVSAEQAEIDVLIEASKLTSRALEKKDTAISELEAENKDLHALPVKTADGSCRPLFMAMCRAAMLECGVSLDKLGTAAALVYAAWHEHACPFDTPSPSSFRDWNGDFAERDKQLQRERNMKSTRPIHFSVDAGQRHGADTDLAV